MKHAPVIVKLDQPLSNFPWAIGQVRFESESAAQIALRNYTLGGNRG